MESLSLLAVSGSSPKSLLWLFLAIVCICLVIYFLYKAFANTSYLATDSNIRRIQSERDTQLAKLLQAPTRSGLESAVAQIPEDQRLLINTSVLGVRLAGYLGPYSYGVFQEDTATRIALQTGARCLVLEIDYLEGSPDPILLYRNSWGLKYSLNAGSIEKVAKNLAGRAFSQIGDGAPSSVANNPLIVVLYFRNAPSLATEPKKYISFLASVSRQLQSLKNLLVAQTPQGDFRRQGLESQLFFFPTKLFENKVLLFTNVDTTPFRSLSQYGIQEQYGPEDDLDYLVHARLYGRESPSPFSNTSSPSSSQQPAAVLSTPQYWLTIPPDRLQEAVANTKKAWTLVMDPDAETEQLTADALKQLFTTYGVQCVPISLADSPQKVDKWLATGGPFASSAWNVKPEPLRFIPPKAIPIQKPMPQMNAAGGALPSPSL